MIQQHTLEKFKKELRDEGQFVPERMDDAMLLRYHSCTRAGSVPQIDPLLTIAWAFSRFLRARKFDIVAAKEMLVSAEQWRKDFGVDDIVKYSFFFFLELLQETNATRQEL